MSFNARDIFKNDPATGRKWDSPDHYNHNPKRVCQAINRVLRAQGRPIIMKPSKIKYGA